MARYAYVNGRFVPHTDAVVHVEDRGYQFADGVYEVVTIIGGKLVDEQGHLDRLTRSLNELRIAWPVTPRVLKLLMRRADRAEPRDPGHDLSADHPRRRPARLQVPEARRKARWF